ncbi:aldolase/citrate lyase family protein [Vibrio nitrifigilis]|uniref:2-dehydro-3-deoxyglucarate aldolase n=1 Tax=Vibrio nitrifigilis TaxID=2789781 RepID=A0ABS0GIJ9_9VIBR|nr:aldolase/citrate lyase family protein [Vibrio nitrifigilis]MBF9002267.1 2-dehydro-3-deoxyglucarate aldolase [Vibrio nitrifigilis]
MKNIFPNQARQKLINCERMIGCWAAMTNPLTTELLGQIGFDWILIDSEHAPNDINSLIHQLMALKDSDSAPFVRPTFNDKVEIKRLLDIGFYNFLVPFVCTKEEAENAVSYTRYPSAGVRGVSVAHRSNNWGFQPDYQQKINDNISIVVQIEDRSALTNVEDILAVDGIDGVFIGPSDLAASLGHLGNPSHPEVFDSICNVINAAKKAGKSCGILAPKQDDANRYLELGANFVAVGSDIGIFKSAAVQLKEKFL